VLSVAGYLTMSLAGCGLSIFLRTSNSVAGQQQETEIQSQHNSDQVRSFNSSPGNSKEFHASEN